MNHYVWYASYGSNLSYDRFMCYIEGGRPLGSNQIEKGCLDKAPPVKDKAVTIRHELRFVQRSKRWNNQGVAVISHAPSDGFETLGRMYLITKEQFYHVVMQENNLSCSETCAFDLPKVGEMLVIAQGLYGRILCIGQEEGYPIYTFTSVKAEEELMINGPCEAYLQMIARGMLEIYDLSTMQLVNYFKDLKGVAGHYTQVQLMDLFNRL